VQDATVGCRKRIFAADPSEISRLIAESVDIDILRAAMAPAIFVESVVN
jgi:hypothetical protein